MFVSFGPARIALLTTMKPKKKKKNIDTNKLSRMLANTDADIESISSDGEIYLDQINDDKDDRLSIHVNPELEEHSLDYEITIERIDDERLNVDNHIAVVDEVNNPSEQQQRRNQRSAAAKKRRNKKRNNHQKLSRYEYPIYRGYYYKIKAKIARRILKHYHVDN